MRSLLAERVRLSDLQAYLMMQPHDTPSMSIAAQVISHASDVFCKLQRGMGTNARASTHISVLAAQYTILPNSGCRLRM